MAVPTFLRVSTTISPMHVIFAHNVPLFAGWRRCWLYACKLSKGLRHLGFLQTIPTSLEWPDCMLKICNTSSKWITFKLCTTYFIFFWILQWQEQRKCNKFFQWHENGGLQSINVLLNVNCLVELETINAYRDKWLDKYPVGSIWFRVLEISCQFTCKTEFM
jgi:hypothetical protein